jgi:hypothetical protein
LPVHKELPAVGVALSETLESWSIMSMTALEYLVFLLKKGPGGCLEKKITSFINITYFDGMRLNPNKICGS